LDGNTANDAVKNKVARQAASLVAFIASRISSLDC
jgi:hypothetical protein